MKRSLFSILASMVLALGFVAPTWAADYPYTAEEVARVNDRSIFFAHNSVGANIIDALKILPGDKVIVRSGNQPNNVKGITEHQLGGNGNPFEKIRDFGGLIRNGGSNTQIAFFKFCYMDFDSLTTTGSLDQVDPLWSYYTHMLDNFQKSRPNVRFVHVTVPLYAHHASWNNKFRHEFNQRLRQRYANLVFDLADIQAHDSNGNEVLSFDSASPAMADEWAAHPMNDPGHMNPDGGRHAAAALIGFLANVPLGMTDDYIQKAYVAFFNRPADVEGLTYWKIYPGNAEDLLTEFSNSIEYQSDFYRMNNTAIISRVYQNLFNREPEPGGLAYWTTQMNAGHVSIANVAYAVLNGARDEDMDIITNKVRAANMFTGALDTPAKVIIYELVGQIGAGHLAKDWLAAVNENNESVNVAEATLGAVIDLIVEVGHSKGLWLAFPFPAPGSF